MFESTMTLDHLYVNKPNQGISMPGFPRKCSCGGRIHAGVSDNNYHGVTIVYKCDDCDFSLELIEE